MEYLGRTAVIKAVDNHLNAVLSKASENVDLEIGTAAGYDMAHRHCIDLIRKIPAADVVEVVRCKDCKHYVPAEDDGEMMCVKDADWCVEDGCYYGFTDSHDADWFCADGERKGGDGE